MDAFETGALVTAIDDTAEPGAVGAAGLAALCPHADTIAPTATIVAVVNANAKPRPLRFDPGASAMSVRSSQRPYTAHDLDGCSLRNRRRWLGWKRKSIWCGWRIQTLFNPVTELKWLANWLLVDGRLNAASPDRHVLTN